MKSAMRTQVASVVLGALVAFCGLAFSSNEALAASSAAPSATTSGSAPGFRRTQRFAARARLQPTAVRKVTTCRETPTEFRCQTSFTK